MGLGRHVEYVSSKDVVSLAKIALVIDVLYLWNLAWSKISVLLLYYRVFRFGYLKSAAYAIGALVVLLAVVSTFLTGFLCVPLSKVWDDSLPGHCLSQQNLRIFNSASTIVTDIIILCLPMPQIWKLQLRKAQKTCLTCLFALGFLWVSPCLLLVTRCAFGKLLLADSLSLFSIVFAAAYRISVFIQ